MKHVKDLNTKAVAKTLEGLAGFYKLNANVRELIMAITLISISVSGIFSRGPKSTRSHTSHPVAQNVAARRARAALIKWVLTRTQTRCGASLLRVWPVRAR